MIGELSPRDWPEDFGHENGNYSCTCRGCGETFIGHKRRVFCKQCTPRKEPMTFIQKQETTIDGEVIISTRATRPLTPPEPSGLWAWWNDGLEDRAHPWLAIESKPSWIHALQLPASMTAGEIAQLRVGDCRRMKGE
jgi:hypothetical protein